MSIETISMLVAIVVSAVGIVGVIVGVVVYLFKANNNQIKALDESINKRIDTLEGTVNNRLASVDTQLVGINKQLSENSRAIGRLEGMLMAQSAPAARQLKAATVSRSR